jgi:hypothetical protein
MFCIGPSRMDKELFAESELFSSFFLKVDVKVKRVGHW